MDDPDAGLCIVEWSSWRSDGTRRRDHDLERPDPLCWHRRHADRRALDLDEIARAGLEESSDAPGQLPCCRIAWIQGYATDGAGCVAGMDRRAVHPVLDSDGLDLHDRREQSSNWPRH